MYTNSDTDTCNILRKTVQRVINVQQKKSKTSYRKRAPSFDKSEMFETGKAFRLFKDKKDQILKSSSSSSNQDT